MATRETKSSALALGGLTLAELRALAGAHATEVADPEQLDRQSLIAALSRAAPSNPALGRELKKLAVSSKPSFYMMIVASQAEPPSARRTAISRLRSSMEALNASLRLKSPHPVYRDFRVDAVRVSGQRTYEIDLMWERVLWYWHPSFSLKHIYEVRLGFVVVDFEARKAVIACQTRHERDLLAGILEKALPMQMTPLVLTRELLDRVGTFDQVKRALYVLKEEDAERPLNVTYADESLALKRLAREQEEDQTAERKQSFYRIPIGGLLEQGLGVTSDTGKFWVPRAIPLPTIKQFARELLARIAETLDDMTDRGDLDAVVRTLGVTDLPEMRALGRVDVRNDVWNLFVQLVNMLNMHQAERAYTPTPIMAAQYPSLWSSVRLRVNDEETNEAAYWRSRVGTSQMVQVQIRGDDDTSVIDTATGLPLDTTNLEHPITGRRVTLGNPLLSLELIPSPRLVKTLLQAAQHASHQVASMRGVVDLPFRIVAGVLRLNLDRALRLTPAAQRSVEIALDTVRELRTPLLQSVATGDRDRLLNRLKKLGEKCKSMADERCATCVSDRRFLCLRSLVGSHPRNLLLLAHKGIELSDMQGTVNVQGDDARVWFFAKMAKGSSGLTVKNNNGAILLAQVVGQIDKQFDVVGVISPSTINEDLRERLATICSAFGKRLLFLDLDPLERLLQYFEEQAGFESLDVATVYRASAKAPASS